MPQKLIGGHYASPDLGLPFHGYVAGGAEDDHEGTRVEDAVAASATGYESDAAVWICLAGCCQPGHGDH